MMKRNSLIPLAVIIIIVALGAVYLIHANGRKSTTVSQSGTAPTSSSSSSVDLSGQQLTELPASITNQTNITSLNLSNNQLVTLPSSIGNLINLKVLNVENNRLQSLPPEIEQLKNLTDADFSNNRLTSLPSELGNLKQLKTLGLTDYKGPSSDIQQLKIELPNTQIKF